MASQPKIARLEAYIGVNFENKAQLMGISLKYKGLLIPDAERNLGGAKTIQKFLFDENTPNDIAATIEYQDVVVNNSIVKIRKHLKLYAEDGTVYCDKVEFELVRDEQKLKISRSHAAYTRLLSDAKGTPAEPLVNGLLNHYSAQVSTWLLGNNQPLIDAINNETDATILYYLSVQMQGVTNAQGVTKTVKDEMIETVSGIQWT